ncbi:MAG: Thioredoxin reductase [Candidatus Curtissbacteria bacterium GW2011_GWA1_40_47]|nr:MAG: Thioredoxin reductase [Candidatus Curtissbacteria bacterium GW2011_GWA1_40_47]
MVDKIRNIIIIGSGPAGLTAALYNARANLNPLVIAGVKWGGQLMLTTNVENYPGFPQGILGPDLMQKFRDQAGRFGAEILNVDVVSVNFKSRPFKIVADSKSYSTKSVIVAAGAETNWLNLPNEQRLIGKGVSSCAPCDAFFFKDKKVIKFATSVAIVHRRDEFRASKIMLGRARANKKISFIINSQVVDVLGRDKVEGVKIKNVKDGKVKELPIDGMFLAIGQSPLTNIFKGQIGLDERGYVKRVPQGDGPGKFQMTTSVEGVFVAGDVHDYHYRQAVTAAGYGCSAALEAEKWLEAQSD